MLPGLPEFGTGQDQTVIVEPQREVVELRTDDERVVHVLEPITVAGGGGGAVSSVNGETGAVVLDKADIGLGNVDNTSDANKPVSTATQTALDGKSATGHTHVIASVTGLQAALDGKAAVVHVHAIADITSLQSTLDGKAAVVHAHAIADVTGLQAALDGKAATGHTHVIANVTGLQSALDGKAASIHVHDIADVNGLLAALNGKADSAHSHALADVTGLTTELSTLTTGLDDLGDEVDGKIPYALFDTKGDLVVGSGVDAAIRLPVGANNQVLTADSSQIGGLIWASPAAGGEQEAYGPIGSGFDEWTCDPSMCSTHYPTNSGTLFLVRHRFRKAMTIDEIGFVLQQAGTTPGAYSGVAVYADGTGSVGRQAQSADQGAAFTTIGAKSLALTAGAAVAAGEYRWIGYLWQGSTPPRLHAPPGPVSDTMMNVGRRRSVFLGSQTAFPATLDVSTMILNTTTYWFSFKDIP